MLSGGTGIKRTRKRNTTIRYQKTSQNEPPPPPPRGGITRGEISQGGLYLLYPVLKRQELLAILTPHRQPAHRTSMSTGSVQRQVVKVRRQYSIRMMTGFRLCGAEGTNASVLLDGPGLRPHVADLVPVEGPRHK